MKYLWCKCVFCDGEGVGPRESKTIDAEWNVDVIIKVAFKAIRASCVHHIVFSPNRWNQRSVAHLASKRQGRIFSDTINAVDPLLSDYNFYSSILTIISIPAISTVTNRGISSNSNIGYPRQRISRSDPFAPMTLLMCFMLRTSLRRVVKAGWDGKWVKSVETIRRCLSSAEINSTLISTPTDVSTPLGGVPVHFQAVSTSPTISQISRW